MQTIRLGAIALLALLIPGSSSFAQVIRLSEPAASLPDAFSYVRGVRELSNGRLLVADWIENRVVMVDLATGSVTDVVKEGGGPNEVRLPTALVRYRGDSTLLVDYGNNRIMVLSPTGRAVRSIVSETPGPMGVRGADASGVFYFAIPSWAENPPLSDDSVRVVRWVPGTDATRAVVVVQATRWRKDRSPSQEPRIPTVGFASQDAWVVASSGEIMIVRAQPFRVEILGADGRVRVGDALPVTTRAVTRDDKVRFVREFGAGAAQSGRGENGGMGRAPLPTAAEIARQVETTEFAPNHPPFDASAVHIAPNGRLWVGQPAVPGQPVRYDVFDANGRRVQQVELRAGRRVAHVGAHGVYVVSEGEDGVQGIERYRLP